MAIRLGQALAERHLELVYGGGGVGLMGEVADAVLAAGGHATGIIPKFFAERVSHRGLTQLHVVDSMHQRKAMMFDLADGFIALPGGLGTLEELAELLTWAQLGLHRKPCGLLNANGYFDRLLSFLDHAVTQGFVKPEHRGLLLVSSDPADLLAQFANFRAPSIDKWWTGTPETSPEV